MDQIEAIFDEKVRLSPCICDQKWMIQKFDDFVMKMRWIKSRLFLMKKLGYSLAFLTKNGWYKNFMIFA